MSLTGRDGEEDPATLGAAADASGDDGFQAVAHTSRERGRGGLQTDDDGQVCRGWPNWADECPEAPYETVGTQTGCGEAAGRQETAVSGWTSKTQTHKSTKKHVNMQLSH